MTERDKNLAPAQFMQRIGSEQVELGKRDEGDRLGVGLGRNQSNPGQAGGKGDMEQRSGSSNTQHRELGANPPRGGRNPDGGRQKKGKGSPGDSEDDPDEEGGEMNVEASPPPEGCFQISRSFTMTNQRGETPSQQAWHMAILRALTLLGPRSTTEGTAGEGQISMMNGRTRLTVVTENPLKHRADQIKAAMDNPGFPRRLVGDANLDGASLVPEGKSVIRLLRKARLAGGMGLTERDLLSVSSPVGQEDVQEERLVDSPIKI
jgi:hypothetical protein